MLLLPGWRHAGALTPVSITLSLAERCLDFSHEQRVLAVLIDRDGLAVEVVGIVQLFEVAVAVARS